MAPGQARHRVVLRAYGGDGLRHAYLALDLGGRSYDQVHPVCHPPLGYHLAHLTQWIGRVDFRDLGNHFDACRPCGLWLHDTPHDIVCDGDILAQHGVLDIPAIPRLPIRAPATVPLASGRGALAAPANRQRARGGHPDHEDGHRYACAGTR
ncbi:MAG TPA: hypothetical protein VFG15_18640 [Amycolatopsis sp.]|nr:hypothetical protein [Amycolatopsis sp.]